MPSGPIRALSVRFLFSSLAAHRRAGKNAPAAFSGVRVMTFAYRVDRWTDDGNSILDYVAAVADFAIARTAYRAACRRWPKAKITLRQGARIVHKSWHKEPRRSGAE
jgi:hypothetical protein